MASPKSKLPDNASSIRIRLEACLNTWACEGFIASVNLISILAVCLETDHTATQITSDGDATVRLDGPDTPAVLVIANDVIVCFYVLELGLRIYTFGFAIFRDKFSLLDACIVSLDVILAFVHQAFGPLLPDLSAFRLLRLLRLRRAVSVFQFFPELNLMIRGLAGAFRAIFWGIQLVFVMLIFWSVVGVQVIHNINVELAMTGYYAEAGCERCPRAFSSIGACLITFTQQIVTGDSWGQVTIPIMEFQPITALYFLSVYVSVGMVLMNLILAVVVEKASQAQNLSVEEQAQQHKEDRELACDELLQLCETIDGDKSGKLTVQELLDGFDSSPNFAAMMEVMDVAKKDMEVVFAIMDVDESGDVDFREFVTELHKMKATDTHTLLVFIKFYVTEIRKKVAHEINVLESSLGVKLDRLMELKATPENASVEDVGTATSTFDVDKLAAVHEQLLLVLREVANKGEAQTKALQTITSVLSPELDGDEQAKVPLLLPVPSPQSRRDIYKDGEVSSFAPHCPQLQSGHSVQHHLLQDIKKGRSHWSERQGRQGSTEHAVQERREPVDDNTRCLTTSCCSIHRSAVSTSSLEFADVRLLGLPPPPNR
eukprot:TRINITY_DN8143_c0_g2_i4.p1 TRINITY_DN8143_c0_g2~~TRINITY_DN8143_c0_g2_i4.p1  ORF type:complete len:601 (+),score=94.23 TRINITY_DN8143_c0_g2_i4:88-1890(+)